MHLPPGTKVGCYEVAELLGAGGMGEVYRARDTRLKRDVAIKVLPDTVAENPERMARFQREAEVLAALNHPHIAHIYGIEDRAIVMELVEGDSPKGPLPFDEAWKIALQIADALDYAHERGIVHRDLKPANVKITPDGVVKLLDFGLAKAFTDKPGTSTSQENSPTLTLGATQLGMILGTAAYMAPEQAKGKSVDKRADIWAWGVVLYELVTGEQLFDGEDAPDTLAQVLTKQPDLERVPPQLRNVLQRCLEKDPKNRLRDIGDTRYLLDKDDGKAEPAPPATQGPPRRHYLALAVLAAVLLVALAALGFVHFRESSPPKATAVRFQIPTPVTNLSSAPSLSPDGRYLVFSGTDPDGKSMLWLHSFDSLETRTMPGTEGASAYSPPFWSPDNRYIVFYADTNLKKIDVSGGPPQTLCAAEGFSGGAWNQDGVIVFGRQNKGLFRMSANGGDPVAIGGLDDAGGSISFLSDKRHFLYATASPVANNGAINAATIDGKEKSRVLGGSQVAAYSPPARAGDKARILFVRENTLMAQALDESTLTLMGDPAPIAGGVAFFSVSSNGTLAYRSRGLGRSSEQLIWFDRSGKSLGTLGGACICNDVALSPDGKWIAVTTLKDGNMDIWVLDAAHGNPTRFTFDPAQDWDPLWAPDGKQITFASQRAGPDQIFSKGLAGDGEERQLWKSSTRQRPKSWSPDGKYLLFMNASANSTGYNLWILDVAGPEPKAAPYLPSPYNITQGQFSPGPANAPRWVAYTSNESGQNQVYIQSFPAGSGKVQVSANGGVQPRWRKDGKELFYLSLDRKLMAVDVNLKSNIEYSAPKELFQTSILVGGGFVYVFRYDVAPDGKRFLVLTDTGKDVPISPPVTIVLNWTAGLRRDVSGQ